MLRDATEADVDRIREWRNHPRVREVSLTHHEIGPDEHRAWWTAVRDDPARRVLVYERGGVPAGVVTFTDHDPVARTASWGFYLDLDGLDARDQTLPAWIEVQRDAVAYAFDQLDLAVLTGEVLSENDAVRSMNARFGFVEGPEETRQVDGRAVRVRALTLRREDRRGARRRRTEGSRT